MFLFLKCILKRVGIYYSVSVWMWLLTPCRSLLLNRTVDVLWQVDYEPIIYAALLIKRKTAYYSSLARSLISATRFGCWRWSVIKKKRGSFMAEFGKHQEITLWITHSHTVVFGLKVWNSYEKCILFLFFTKKMISLKQCSEYVYDPRQNKSM